MNEWVSERIKKTIISTSIKAYIITGVLEAAHDGTPATSSLLSPTCGIDFTNQEQQRALHLTSWAVGWLLPCVQEQHSVSLFFMTKWIMACRQLKFEEERVNWNGNHSSKPRLITRTDCQTIPGTESQLNDFHTFAQAHVFLKWLYCDINHTPKASSFLVGFHFLRGMA